MIALKRLKNPSNCILLLSTIVVLAIMFVNAFAVTKTWTGNGTDNNWSNTANWQSGVVPVNNDTIIFNSSSIARLNNTNDISGLTGISIQITTPGAGPIVISGNALSIGGVGYGSVDMSGATQDLTINNGITIGYAELWNVNSGRTLNLNGTVLNSSYDFAIGGSGNSIISGVYSGVAGNIAENGPGSLTLSGANTFGGTTILNGGMLNINNPAALGTGTLSINGGTIDNTSGESITLANNNAQTWNGDFVFTGTNDLNLGNGTVSTSASRQITVINHTLAVGGIIGGAYGLTKAGPGVLMLSGANTYTGNTSINTGKLLITNLAGSGTGSGNVSVNSGATLAGTGTTASTVAVTAGGTLAPGVAGPGILTINNNLTFAAGATFAVDLNGTTAGTNYDQLIANGTVTLSGAMLQLTLGYAPAINDAYTIIHGTAPVGGTFNGIPDGGLVIAPYNGSSYKFTVSYAGGTGNDVVLTCAGLNTTKIWNNTSGDSKWSNPENWAPPGMPAPTDTVGFSAALTCSLDVNATIRTIKFPPAFTGPFKFLNDTLFISDSADFTGPTNNFFISPGTGALEFIGPGNHSLNAKQGLQLPGIIQNSNGVTTVRFAPVSAKSLLIKNGTFNLGSFNDTLGTFGGPNGTIDLSSSGLIVSGPMADFSQLTVLTDLFSHVEFRGSYSTQTFVPKPTYVFPWVGSSAWGDTVVISTNPLSAKKVGVGSTNGGWRWGNGFTHLIDTVASLASANNVMDFGNSTVKITSGNIDFSGIGKIKDSASAKIEFSGVSGLQTLSCPSTTIDTLPGIVHSGPDTLFQMGNLKCRSFLQTAGTFKINGQHDTITTGNFTDTNTTFAAASFCNLDNSFIVTENGDIVLKGHPNDSINLNPANPWNVTALNGHSISADYALISHSAANAVSENATNSRDIGGTNTGWIFIAPNTKYWKGSGADSLWSSAYNWLPNGVPQASDSVVFDNTAIKGCQLNANQTIRTITVTPAFSKTLDFFTGTLSVSGDVNFTGMTGTITAGSGVIALNGTTTQTFYPPYSGAPYKLPKIIVNNPNGANVPYNRLYTSNLTIISGYMTLNSQFNIDSIIVNSPGSLDMSYSYNYDTVVTISGTGNLNMGFADFVISGDMNVGNLNSFIPENAHIKFIGPNNQAFDPNDFGVPTWVEQINGTTVVLNKRLIVQNLYLTGGTFNLGIGLQDTIINELGGGAGTLDFGSSTLNLQTYTATDFSTVNFIANSGTLAFCGPSPQTFYPRPGVLHPDIVQNGYNGTIIYNNPLKAKSLTINQGSFTFSHTGSLRDSVGSLIATTTGTNASIALGQDTLDISGSVNLSGLTNFMWTVPGVMRFVGSAPQPFMTPFSYNPTGYWCPPIIHNGSGMITQAGMLKCASFLQTAGTYNLNGAIDSIMDPSTGNFTITNGTAGSITGLGNSTIAVKSGNASFSGQGAANMLNLSPAAPWTLSVPTMSKTISAQYTIIGNCKAITYAPLTAQPQFCAMAPGDSNWNIALVMPQIYDTLGTPNLLAASPRAAGDTIDIWYELNDPDNAVDTVKMSFRNGVSGAWTAPVTGTIMGDIGPVASNAMSVHRHVRWSVTGQFGGSFSSDSIQIGLTAQDNFGNVTPKIMPVNNIHVNTKGPTFGSNIFILPSAGSIIAGGSVCSITWNWANISFNVQAKNFPLTLQYSLDNGNTFTNSTAGNLQNTGSYSWTTLLITSKNVLLRFAARDTLGNVSYGPLSAAFTIHATPPASNITLPANKSYVNSLAGISGNASDSGSGVKNVFIAIKTSAGNYWNGVSMWTPTQTWLSTVLNPSNAWVCNNNAPTGLTNGSAIVIMSRATDSANNVQTVYGADTVTVDTIAPVSTITYPVNNTSISSLGSISGTASDAGAGVSGLVISLENVTDTTYWNGTAWTRGQMWLTPAGLPVGFATWTYVAPTLTNGKKYLIQSKATDAAGNTEAPGPGVTFIYSTSAPGLPTIAIVNRQKYINNPLVSLTLSVQNADSMQFHLNAGAWTAWEQFVSSKTNFSIAAGGQGAKYIYVEYKDKIGNMTAPVSDSTFYDTIPPKCAINTVGAMNPAIWNHVVSGISFDTMPGSGVKTVSVRLRNQATGACWNGAAWVPDSTSVIWTTATGTTAWNCSLATAAMNSGIYVIQACALDSAGNKGPVVIDSLQLLVPPGAPLISINKTNRFTNSPFVTLMLSAQNVDSMQFRLDAGPWSAWEPYATTKTNMAINTGGEGLRKVWVS